ncbi:MAG TPA: hypothetical protein VKX17_07110 [Planctomycetota bacterium]|nr:hypothetical protein [Planctomycetota bacterium]
MTKTFAQFSTVVLIALAPTLLFAAADSDPKPRAALGIWDTGTNSADALAPAALDSKEGWAQVPLEQAAWPFKGDAVLSNGKLTAVVRKQGGGAIELYSPRADGWFQRAKLQLIAADGSAANALDHVNVAENAKGQASLEAVFKSDQGATLSAKFQLKKGDIVLQAEPGAGAAALRVNAESKFAVLPDLFADDIVINPHKIPSATTEIPSENFLLQLVGSGDAIVMSVFENKTQDAKLLLSGEGDARTISASEIAFGSDKPAADGKSANKVWVTVMEGPNVWYTTEVKKDQTGKVVPLDWKMPIVAGWRVDFTRPNELTDSWTLLLQDKEGYAKPSWLGRDDESVPANRKRWNTVLGTYSYPAYSDSERRAFLQPIKNRELSFEGPVLIYPIARQKQTPKDAYTVMDVVRFSLGVGPCEYILDLEGQKGSYKGRATCNTRDTLRGIYEKNQQKDKRAEVSKILDEAMAFCTHIRGRINRYVEFGTKMHEYLAEQKKAHPELSAFIDEMDKFDSEIDKRYAARKEKIRTLEYVAQLNDEFRKNVLNDDSPQALDKCKKYGHDLVEVGDNQDELSAECRWAVKALRQRAGLALAMDPKVAPIANEIRARTHEALKNPANHEGAQH